MALVALLLGLAATAAEARDYAPELPAMTAQGRPAIERVVPSAAAVPRFGKLELTVKLAATYDNPFDPEQVDLAAEFTTPSKKRVVVPGFFYQPYRHRNPGDDARRPLLDADGEPCWKIRFTPTEVGPYVYAVRLRNRFGDVQGDVTSDAGRFDATPSEAAGFLRVAKANHRYFEFDAGRPFFAVGQNLQNDWPYYRHSRLLAAGGANALRVWTFCHWTWLEWSFTGPIRWAGPGDWMRSYAGAGRYNQRVAWIADDCLERWTRDGLFVMLCLGNATGGGELSATRDGSYGSWAGHPYNKAHGGWLDDPHQFWTDPRARQLYRQRLRYIVARWGYSPNIWAFEFWNELGAARPEIADWHREMGRYLRQIDPNRHLVTTSTWTGNADKFAAVWDLPEMDFTQGHHYGALPGMVARIGEHLRRWPKPYINGEGGGPPARPEEGGNAPAGTLDPESIEFHNSLWAPLGLGSAGTTLPWWWRDRVEPQDLFSHYRAVARFADGVPWNAGAWRGVELHAISLSGPSPEAELSPVLIAPAGADWGSKSRRNRFRVEPDGRVPGIELLAGELFGNAPSRRDWRNPPVFEVEFPRAGKCIVHVSRVVHGILEVRLDGQTAARGSSPGDYSIDVPAGRHEIRLDNAGADQVGFSSILLTNYRDARRFPDLNILGQQTDRRAVLWIHNRLRQWPYQAAGIAAPPVGPATATLGGWADGRYRVEWWNTLSGTITRTQNLEARNKTLALPIPVVDRDVACKIEREGS